jgi:poly-gamma-glutamate synthesis protein (capsule biosynthesis protein)
MCISTKSRKSSRLAEALLWVLLAAVLPLHGGPVLPVFLADNHAETFGWITRTVDLDQAHVLALVDAHSDASAAERSEEIREQLRRVASLAERAERVEAWRADGRLQAFNWLEPLMPRPVDRVLWLAAPELTADQRANLHLEAVRSLDGRLEVEPRAAGSLARRWETRDLPAMLDWEPGGRAVILCVDLDFFAGMTPELREARFGAIWKRAMDWPGLAGVAFSVSRPWLTDAAEADALVALALDAVRHTRGASLEVDASMDDRPDDSLRAAAVAADVPRWDLAQASAAVRARLAELSAGGRLVIHDRGRPWLERLDAWSAESGAAVIRPAGDGEIDCDGVWRVAAGEEPALRLERAMPEASGRVRWWRLVAARDAYDLVPETGLGKDFANSPGRWIHEQRTPLGETEDFQLAAAVWRADGGGRVRVSAEYETPAGWLPVAPVELRIRTAGGFRGALSECFGMPYVFGIAAVSEDDLGGVECGWGSDCSNLLIHAWRRSGIPLEWGDPGHLRRQLVTKTEAATAADRVGLDAAEIERGVAIDFGRHVAALWQDREPLGILDGNDLVLHHLGGLPELVELAELTKTRPVFALRVPPAPTACRIAFAGDVVLAGDRRVVIDGFEPGGADLFLANLEGIPSLLEPEAAVRYDFRFDPERLAWLKSRGVDGVSLANNHALDAGHSGLLEGLAALERAGIGTFGAGRNEAEACRPLRIERRGVALAVFGICYLEANEAGPDRPGVAGLPRHRERLEEELALARANGERVIVLVHGGDEYRRQVNPVQRRWARWLSARGARVIAGAHPHVLQRGEIHGGTQILHSLGNAIYPADLKGADSGEVRVIGVP